MKNDNIKKRWFYDLTEKQVYKIIPVFEFVFFVIMIFLIPTFPIWTTMQVQKGIDKMLTILLIIVTLFGLMVALGLLIWLILWENPNKRFYLLIIVPMVRKKFGLNSEFKEVIPKLNAQNYKYFAKETKDGIFIVKRNKDGEVVKSELIRNYYNFDLINEPKI